MRRLLLPAMLCVGVALPFCGIDDYRLFQLTMLAVWGIALVGLSLLTGQAGQISLGHGAFCGLGAYVTAILISRWDVPYWLALPASALTCGVAGALLAVPALRLEGPYLALSTFAVAVATPQLLKAHALEAWTGGVQGLEIDKPDAPFGLPLTQDQWLYLLTLGVAIVAYLVAWRLSRGWFGRGMRAVRDQSVAAASLGIDIAKLKTQVFGLSALYAGLAGSLAALADQFVSPDAFGAGLSIVLFVGLVVGGPTRIGGTLIGAAFIAFVPQLAQSVSKAAPGAIYGVVLIAALFVQARRPRPR